MKTSPLPLVLLAALAAATTSTFAAPVDAGRTNARPSCCAEPLAGTAPLPDKSLYQSESRWTTDAGKEVSLCSLRGRPQVIALFFTTCRSTCPVIVQDLRRLEAALPAELRSRVGFTLVSFDSERDTPEALAAYRRTRQLPDDRWTLLRGDPGDVLELAALLGVRFKQEANGQFAHSNTITVLNAAGEIVHQRQGLGTDLTEAGRVVEKLLQAPGPEVAASRPPVNPGRP